MNFRLSSMLRAALCGCRVVWSGAIAGCGDISITIGDGPTVRAAASVPVVEGCCPLRRHRGNRRWQTEIAHR